MPLIAGGIFVPGYRHAEASTDRHAWSSEAYSSRLAALGTDASSLRQRAEIELRLNRLDEAELHFRESLAAAEKGRERDRSAAALGLLLARGGRITEASDLLGPQLQRIDSLEPQAAAETYFAAAELAYRKDRNIQAMREHLESALNLFEQAADDEALCLSQVEYAYALTMLGDRSSSRASAELALTNARTTDNNRCRAFALIAIGDALQRIGDWHPAYQAFREAESIFPEGIDLQEFGILNNRLGTHFRVHSDLRLSRDHYLRALKAFEHTRNSYGVSELNSVLGEIEMELGNQQAAAQRFELGLQEATRNRDPISLAVAHENRGVAALQAGDHTAAKNYLETALKQARTGGIRLREASILNRLAKLLIVESNLVEARNRIAAAIEINESINDQFALSSDIYLLSEIERQSGNLDRSIELKLRSLEDAEKFRLTASNRKLSQGYFQAISNRYESLVADLMQRGDQVEGLAAAERSRASYLNQSLVLAGASAFHVADPDLAAREMSLRADINSLSDRLTNVLASGTSSEERIQLEADIAKTEISLEEVRLKMRSESQVFAAFSSMPEFDVGRLQNVLSADEVVIEYHIGRDNSYGWAIAKSAAFSFDLPGQLEIDGKIDSVIQTIVTRKSLNTESFELRQQRIFEADVKYTVAARELSNIILGPVAEKIKGKRLIVVPDGKLNYFPISALPMPGAESDDPILLTNEVIYQPSAQTYALLKKIGQERKDERAKDLLVFSDPVFNPADERLTGIEVAAENSDGPYRFRLVESFSNLSRLPASKTEAETVSNAVGGSDLFMGFDATRERLLSTNLADYKVLHLATHGFLDPERPELSSLILSRYDIAGKAIDESIRMHDIYSMKLNADLVVLSACQTGTGKEIKGEGVMGLNTAFLQSGARSVVSTLWQVEDNAANELMKEFYGKMVDDGMSPSAALRAAQIKLYQDPQFRSPFFWAAFTIHGDAATATPFKRDHTKLTIALSALALLSLAAFFFFRRNYRTSKV